MSLVTYPVHERFESFQGEGVFMGQHAFFIRLFGCPIHCPWCDSAGTWHKDWVPKDIVRMRISDLVNEAAATHPAFVVVTGGEPTVYDLEPLVDAMHEANLKVHLETSGAFEFGALLDWVTVSPKRWKRMMDENAFLADEFKIIVERPEDIEFYLEQLTRAGLAHPITTPIWFHPEWSHRDDPWVLEAISDVVKVGAGDYRAGWQIHKLYQADQHDRRSRPLVPLGGDPARGL